MSETKFFICNHCKNIIGMIESSGVPVVCCGEKMAELKAGAVEASYEKHIPVVTVEGNTVEVSAPISIDVMSLEGETFTLICDDGSGNTSTQLITILGGA